MSLSNHFYHRGTWLDKNGVPKINETLEREDEMLKKLALWNFASIRNFTDLEKKDSLSVQNKWTVWRNMEKIESDTRILLRVRIKLP